MTTLVVGRFRANHARELAAIARKLPAIAAEESERLMPLLRKLANYDDAERFEAPTGRSDKVSLANLDQVCNVFICNITLISTSLHANPSRYVCSIYTKLCDKHITSNMEAVCNMAYS